MAKEAKKKWVGPQAEELIQLSKHDDGYHVKFASREWKLPTDQQIKDKALHICAEYDSEEAEAVRILRDCDISLELVSGGGGMESVIGVVVSASKGNAEILANDWDIYSDVMGALGEACADIQHDRVVVRE